MPYRTVLARLVLVLALSGLATGCEGAATTPEPDTEPAESQAAPTETVAPPSTGDSNPQTDKVTVPDAVGRGMTSARMVMGSNHLTFEVVTEPPNADLPMDNSVTVTKQDPKPGAIVDSGSTVTLTVKAK